MKRAIVAFLFLARLSATAHAQEQEQERAVIRGHVLDTTGAPIRDAEAVLLGTGFRAVTATHGAFLLREVPAGEYRLVVRHVGFVPLYFSAKILGPDTVDAEIVLRRTVATLDTLRTAGRADNRLPLAEFELNRRIALGKFFTRDELERHAGSNLRTLLPSKVLGFEYVPRPCRGSALASGTAAPSPGLSGQRVVGQGTGCVMPDLCYAQLYVDGVRIFATDHTTVPPSIEDYPLESMEAVEVYTRSADTPARFNTSGAICGTLALWLRR